MGSGKYLKRAIAKHGLEAFSKEILFVFNTEEEMNAKEAEIVTEEYCLREDTYNLCPGGKGGWGYVNQNGLAKGFNDSSIALAAGKQAGKIHANRIKNDKKYRLENYKRLLKRQNDRLKNGTFVNGFKGKTHTEETKAKMRKSKNLGNNNPSFGTIWINNGIEAKKWKGDIPDGWFKGRKLK